MLEEIKNIKSDKSALRTFGITVGLILMIIAGFFFWKGKEIFYIFLTSGVALCFLGFAIPYLLKPIYWIWMIFATIIGWVMTRVILSLLFYVILTPIGLIARLFGKQFVELRWDKSKKSYWNYRSGMPVTENYEKQF
mgnify:FL=1|tara:strand:- start:2110 stop:2520 length:411 start_codon:yes stop_codon:yes gene_type:complete